MYLRFTSTTTVILIATILGTFPLTSAEVWKHFDCGTEASKNFVKNVQTLQSRSASGSLAGRATSLLPRDTVTVPTYFHVISSKPKDGQITQKMADDQVAALNKAYSRAGFQFELKGTDFTVDDAWAIGETDADTTMKKKLRKGPYGALNIYFQTDLTGNVLGRCTLPSDLGSGDAARDPSNFADDGCNVQANTMPGGTSLGYDQGMTAVHETGHWMGLLHTFEGYDCDGEGDMIDDTPAQAESTDGCPDKAPAKDTCPGKDGVDDIHNYMDYSIDKCYEGFTKGQIARMVSMWDMYRKDK